ncbi:uncharacterized protein [Lolium perenne]|uniref:uncharacterized protein n=1 Tax=Lolium perenne TaxID=4522 RepID=UPI0021F587F1|nr:uncharacterized protein LOC127291731 [Lolium perenne]
MSTPPPPLPLVEDLIREVLLRLPPDDPACLPRASLACKAWHRILTDARFLRRYREHHRAPPMLGFLRNTDGRGDFSYTHVARFIPTSSFRPAVDTRRGLYAIAARHGRVLLHTDPYAGPPSLVVWDPVTDEQCDVPPLPEAAQSRVCFNAVVLCAAAGCDHLDCHGGPFAVAYVGLPDQDRSTFACLYSSEAGEWGEPAMLEEAAATSVKSPGVLVGNAVYFTCIHQVTPRIVEYDMGRGELSVIDLPSTHRCQPGAVLTVTEDGKLGFAGLLRLSLYLWSREAGPDGAVAWTQRRVIQLDKMLLHFHLGTVAVWHVPSLIGFADGTGVVFVKTETGRVFSVELESGRYQKTSFPRFHNGDPGQEPIIIPYMSFYTPDRAKGRSLHCPKEA